MTRLVRRVATVSAVLVLTAWSAAAQSNLESTIDAIVEAPIKAGQVAGASVAVVRGAQTIVERGYGVADL
jgi:CubicO group peptidase (beta-lactamase class C family)